MEQYNLYDKNGIPILPGDVLKVFHYIAIQRKEKRYMYKWVQEKITKSDGGNILKNPFLKISHLSLKYGYYLHIMDDRVLSDHEIVQGYEGVKSGQDYRDRERKPMFSKIS